MMEHPANATYWCLDCVQSLVKQSNVMKVNFNVCMFGMRARDAVGEAAATNRTDFITNSVPVAEKLRKMQCQDKHRHVLLMGGKAKACEVYTEEFCRAVCIAIRQDKNKEQKKKAYVMNVTKMMENIPTPHEEANP